MLGVTSRRNSSAAALWLAVMMGTVLVHAQQKPTAAEPTVDLQWAVKIPMRDGVKLNATVFTPHGQKEALPVILTFTPYIGDSYTDRAIYFAKHGYVYALVDVRGCGNSGGEFEPFVNEGRDGYDVVEWLAKQPYCNGKVAMWGYSYGGFDQWSTLKEFPPHLTTIVPVAASHPWAAFFFDNNIFDASDVAWIALTSGVTSNRNLSREQSFWIAKFRELYLGHRAFRELDKIVGNPSPVFQTWLDHPVPDAYYDAMVPTADDYKRITAPILSITGHYDGAQRGAMEFYQRHMRYGTTEAREKHYLIIGPWDHDGTSTPKRDVGGLHFGEASKLDMNKLHQDWYDWTMKRGAKPEFLKKRVAYYVVGPGAENWEYVDSLDNIATEKRSLYLHSDGNAGDVFHSGSLRKQKPDKSPPDHYVYDPLDPRPAELETEDIENYNTDQRFALNLFEAGVVYHSEPFTEATEISGFVHFVAWMALDVPDTDFVATLYEIQPDATSILLTQDVLRARYRDSLRQEKLVKPGEINRYEFSRFTFFSRHVMKGSRLRLVLQASNSIYTQKNYNSGGAVAAESGKDAKTAHVTLFHDGEHPSALELPLVK